MVERREGQQRRLDNWRKAAAAIAAIAASSSLLFASLHPLLTSLNSIPSSLISATNSDTNNARCHRLQVRVQVDLRHCKVERRECACEFVIEERKRRSRSYWQYLAKPIPDRIECVRTHWGDGRTEGGQRLTSSSLKPPPTPQNELFIK